MDVSQIAVSDDPCSASHLTMKTKEQGAMVEDTDMQIVEGCWHRLTDGGCVSPNLINAKMKTRLVHAIHSRLSVMQFMNLQNWV